MSTIASFFKILQWRAGSDPPPVLQLPKKPSRNRVKTKKKSLTQISLRRRQKWLLHLVIFFQTSFCIYKLKSVFFSLTSRASDHSPVNRKFPFNSLIAYVIYHSVLCILCKKKYYKKAAACRIFLKKIDKRAALRNFYWPFHFFRKN